MLKHPQGQEVAQYLQLQMKFYGAEAPEKRVQNVISQFEDVAELGQSLYLLKDDNEILAGTGISGDVFLQSFYFKNQASLEALISGLVKEVNTPLRVYQEAQPEKIRTDLVQCLINNGFVENTDYDVKKVLFGNVTQHADVSHLVAWSEVREGDFEALYDKLASSFDFDWLTVRDRIGGSFTPRLWFMARDNKTIIGINGTQRTENKHIFTVAVAKSENVPFNDLVSQIETLIASEYLDAVVHFHVDAEQLPVMLAQGYEIDHSQKMFDRLSLA